MRRSLITARSTNCGSSQFRYREVLDGQAVWHINSTAAGGGVAEMLPSLLGYCRDLGINTRWLVISGSP